MVESLYSQFNVGRGGRGTRFFINNWLNFKNTWCVILVSQWYGIYFFGAIMPSS